MKKVLLFLSVISITSSLLAVDIFTKTPGKKPKSQKEVTVEVEKKVEVKTDTGVGRVLPRPAEAICPVTGVPIKVNESTPFSEYIGTLYFFLSNNEKIQFDSNPFKFAKDIDTCAICGKQEKKTRNRSSFLETSYNGKIYRFCTLIHSEEFQKDPSKYIRGSDSYATKQAGKKKIKVDPKTGEKIESKDMKKDSEDVELLEEETGLVTPEVKEKKLEVKPAIADIKKESSEVKPPAIELKKDTEAVKTTVPVAPVVNKAPAQKVNPPQKEVTQEIEEIIMEE